MISIHTNTPHTLIHTHTEQTTTNCVCVCVFLGKINMSHRKHSFNFETFKKMCYVCGCMLVCVGVCSMCACAQESRRSSYLEVIVTDSWKGLSGGAVH